LDSESKRALLRCETAFLHHAIGISVTLLLIRVLRRVALRVLCAEYLCGYLTVIKFNAD
jgi:hypothetical protein